eukprot:CAMPEP_0115635714 /NCGR_PEP_ID=MMETSP0272-20121206/33274_1 /TAXON_ID=71861 /ORGANISM="Scrippsiella trochoidea, Strain CCMP3099" /LENGTH=193 /DNA_ID=CAMNT_0003072653 /DNA_START=182 /DNA_END=763 /DNA_ORIENTATION=-
MELKKRDIPATEQYQTHVTIFASIAVGDAGWEDEWLMLGETRLSAAPSENRDAPLSSLNETSLLLLLLLSSAHAAFALALAAFGFPMPARRTRSRFICVLSIPEASCSKYKKASRRKSKALPQAGIAMSNKRHAKRAAKLCEAAPWSTSSPKTARAIMKEDARAKWLKIPTMQEYETKRQREPTVARTATAAA